MSDYITKGKTLLVGSGPMAEAYAEVLKALEADFIVVGRGSNSADVFEKSTGIKPIAGGIDKFIQESGSSLPDQAIVATGIEGLKDVAIKLAKWGVKRILLEKPGGISIDEVIALNEIVKSCQTEVFVGYNRRFYGSVSRLQEIIEEDGGVSSFNFEFTEWSHVIEPLEKAAGVKANWFFANSTHVIDTAFFLGGKPGGMTSYVKGQLSWHPVSTFSGAGISEKGALFSYQANWAAPGRWGVEILTSRHRLYLRPMEKLQIQKLGSVEVSFLPIPDELDIKFKPGVFKQTVAFLQSNTKNLISLEEHVLNCKLYSQILNGGTL